MLIRLKVVKAINIHKKCQVMSQPLDCTLVVCPGLFELISVLQDASLAKVVIDHKLEEGQIVIKDWGRIVICSGSTAFHRHLNQEHHTQQKRSQESDASIFFDPVFIVVISAVEFPEFINTVNSIQTGTPPKFYLAKDFDEVPEKVITIATNMQTSLEFKEFMDKTKQELQKDLLQLY